MPVPTVIANAAENYRFNSDFLLKMVQDLTPEEWLRRPDEKLNHIAWIVGHVIWARKAVLTRLGAEWSQPWLSSFARGVKCNDVAAFPPPDTLMEGWREVSGSVGYRTRRRVRGRALAALHAGASERRRQDQRRRQLPRDP